LCCNSLYRPTIGYFQHFGTSITSAYSTHFVKSSGLNAKAKFHSFKLLWWFFDSTCFTTSKRLPCKICAVLCLQKNSSYLRQVTCAIISEFHPTSWKSSKRPLIIITARHIKPLIKTRHVETANLKTSDFTARHQIPVFSVWLAVSCCDGSLIKESACLPTNKRLPRKTLLSNMLADPCPLSSVFASISPFPSLIWYFTACVFFFLSNVKRYML